MIQNFEVKSTMERLLDTVKESVVIATTAISKECGSSGGYIPTLVQQTNDSDDVNNSHLTNPLPLMMTIQMQNQ
uniref:Uncharacterized protein n=1 Tax=Romanomermis culicivorax TaxID=13658 RepID=A0A915HMJ6_ROMCU